MRSFIRAGSFIAGVAVAVHSMVALSLASSGSPVPEIDGSVITAGLGLLTAGTLLLRSRRSR